MAVIAECIWVPDGTSITILFHIWGGPLRPDLQTMFGTADQDGTLGSSDYPIDEKPREFEATSWGLPDSDRTLAGGTELRDGTHSKLIDNKKKRGTLLFYDGFNAENVKLIDVVYIKPIGIGTGELKPAFEEVRTSWKVEG